MIVVTTSNSANVKAERRPHCLGNAGPAKADLGAIVEAGPNPFGAAVRRRIDRCFIVQCRPVRRLYVGYKPTNPEKSAAGSRISGTTGPESGNSTEKVGESQDRGRGRQLQASFDFLFGEAECQRATEKVARRDLEQ